MKIQFRLLVIIWAFATIAAAFSSKGANASLTEVNTAQPHPKSEHFNHSVGHDLFYFVAEDISEETEDDEFDAYEFADRKFFSILRDFLSTSQPIDVSLLAMLPTKLYVRNHQWRFHLS
ncbi:MAG: hypothetical protein EP346_02060 [Bacteroidetes bacterium]|nr:MAG: hypothetical protein EP346_02060 [Bacteroidota bacterium]